MSILEFSIFSLPGIYLLSVFSAWLSNTIRRGEPIHTLRNFLSWSLPLFKTVLWYFAGGILSNILRHIIPGPSAVAILPVLVCTTIGARLLHKSTLENAVSRRDINLTIATVGMLSFLAVLWAFFELR